MNLKKYKSGYCSRMHSKIKIPVLLITAVALVYQCSVALQVPTVLDAQEAGIPLDTLIKGRATYISHCGSCHSLYLPEKLTSSQWEKAMDKMDHKSHK